MGPHLLTRIYSKPNTKGCVFLQGGPLLLATSFLNRTRSSQHAFPAFCSALLLTLLLGTLD